MKQFYKSLLSFVSSLRDLPPLINRFILCFGFYEPARNKLQHFSDIIGWFGQLGIPAPTLNAYMAVATECSGILLLFLGLGTRVMCVPMMVVMIVAVATVHWQNGFSCSQNGFEVPFYYFCMLFGLIITGPGRFSIDHLIKQKFGDSF